MAIAIDNTNAGAKSTGATSISWSHTVSAALSNSILIVGGMCAGAAPPTMSSAVWDSGGTNAAMSKTINAVTAEQANSSSANDTNCSLWFLKAPVAGTLTVKISPSASSELAGGSSSWSGVDQTTPFNAASPQKFQAASNANISDSVTSATGEEVVDSAGVSLSGAVTAVVGGSQTQIYNQNNGSSHTIGMGSYQGGAATVTMAWTGLTANNVGSCHVAASMKVAAGAGFTAKFRKTLGSTGNHVGGRKVHGW